MVKLFFLKSLRSVQGGLCVALAPPKVAHGRVLQSGVLTPGWPPLSSLFLPWIPSLTLFASFFFHKATLPKCLFLCQLSFCTPFSNYPLQEWYTISHTKAKIFMVSKRMMGVIWVLYIFMQQKLIGGEVNLFG